MKLIDLLSEDYECCYEECYVDENDNILSEASIRQYKRVGQTIKKRYRCMSGPKAGKLVATPGACATRKDPKKVRHGRKVMRSKKGIIKRKAKVTKRKQLSRMVTKMNRRLAGK